MGKSRSPRCPRAAAGGTRLRGFAAEVGADLPSYAGRRPGLAEGTCRGASRAGHGNQDYVTGSVTSHNSYPPVQRDETHAMPSGECEQMRVGDQAVGDDPVGRQMPSSDHRFKIIGQEDMTRDFPDPGQE